MMWIRMPPYWHATQAQMLSLLGSDFTISDLIASHHLLAHDEQVTPYALSSSIQEEFWFYDTACDVVTRFRAVGPLHQVIRCLVRYTSGELLGSFLRHQVGRPSGTEEPQSPPSPSLEPRQVRQHQRGGRPHKASRGQGGQSHSAYPQVPPSSQRGVATSPVAPPRRNPSLLGLGRELDREGQALPILPLAHDDRLVDLRGFRGDWLLPDYAFQDAILYSTQTMTHAPIPLYPRASA